jgi:2-isopropylmalate synthase
MFLGDEPGLKGLGAEVLVGNKKYVVNSPASIYVHAGVSHTYRFVEGSGKYVNVVLAQGGNYNAVTS